MADIITIPMQPLNMYGELVTEDGIEVKNAASISVGTDTITIPMQPAGYGSVLITVKLCPYPIPAVSADRTAGCAPLQVAFSSTASEFLVSQGWTFGDGELAEDANPSHEYTAGGDYTVALTGYNQAGSRQASGTIHVLNPPIAGLEASATSGTAPVTIDFTAVCTGDIDNYDWDFGDGYTSGAQNPSHQYTAAGTYDLSLIASNPYCSDEIVLADYIVVSSGETGHWISKQDASNWLGPFSSPYPNSYAYLENGIYWESPGWCGEEGCAIVLLPAGSWVRGFRPTKYRITYSGKLNFVLIWDANNNSYFGNSEADIQLTADIKWIFISVYPAQYQPYYNPNAAKISNIEFWVEG